MNTRHQLGRLASGRRPAYLLLVLAVLGSAGCRTAPQQGPQPATEDEARTLQDFERRIAAYVAEHKRLEDALPTVPKEATPDQIDARQRELGRNLAAARATAAQGDLITPAMQVLIRRHFAVVFGGPDGANIKGSVMDENPTGLHIKVNDRYPDEVPLSTMPPEVLKILPKMPEELEYRFVGRSLVIVDAHAHLIADLMPDAIPS